MYLLINMFDILLFVVFSMKLALIHTLCVILHIILFKDTSISDESVFNIIVVAFVVFCLFVRLKLKTISEREKLETDKNIKNNRFFLFDYVLL